MIGLLPRRVLPVLMYHRIGEVGQADPSLTVTPPTFARHLDWINARGFRTLSLDEAHDAFRSRRFPRRSVLLTIDDGFDETLRTAAPLLAAAGQRATVFVPSGLLGREARLEPSYGGSQAHRPVSGSIVDGAGLTAWVNAGHGVGSHSLTHADLTKISAAEAAREATESKRLLEDLLGREILDFCYPYAHHDPAARQAARAAGYRAAYAGEPPTQSLWALPRMMVFPDDSERRFARKLYGYYYWLSAWHKRVLRTSDEQ
ncbi:MAG: polysaccharide deacetylase family protein [Acidobacteriota bacterium]|nr:polysaccharide deacetylase family protein [Acidobacteriota bacterium]